MNVFRLTKVWNTARNVTIMIAAIFSYGAVQAQVSTCGLTSITETTAPVYPPIAKAARQGGTVILMVRFKPNGNVEDIHVLSGPQMLRMPARNFVGSWHANEFTGPRECPIIVNFELTEVTCADTSPDPAQIFTRIDAQHVIVRAKPPILCDPAADIVHKRKRFLIF